jgi:hypothetical protein
MNTTNHAPAFRNHKRLMENEMSSIFGRKNAGKICMLRPDN